MKPPVVLIHGFPLDAAMWEPQTTFLSSRGYQVYAPNLPGFGPPGGSAPPWPKERCSIEAFAEEVYQLIQTLPGKQAVVGGFSMGGYVLLALLRDYPDAVRAAMLIDSRAEADTADARANRLKAIQDVSAGGTEVIVDTMLGKVLSKHATPAQREHARTLMARQNPQAVIGAQWAMSRRHDQTDLLAALQIPLLLLVGADDSLTPPSVAIGIHNHVPHAMLVQVARAGHLAPLEQPASVNQAMLTFLKTLN